MVCINRANHFVATNEDIFPRGKGCTAIQACIYLIGIEI